MVVTKSKIKEPRVKVPKIRNNGTMTESAFWSFIRSALRNKSRWFKPISEAKRLARRKYRGPNHRQKWEYQCAECKNWFSDKEIAVDHIVECGSLSKAEDLPVFVERLFCEVEGLQILCKDICHKKKTDEYLANKKLIKQNKT